MATYFVRWYDPTRKAPLFRTFHTKAEAVAFRAKLQYFSDPPKPYDERRQP